MTNPDRPTSILDAGEPCPQPDDASGWWLLPAILAGAGIWAPAAAGVLLVACWVVIACAS